MDIYVHWNSDAKNNPLYDINLIVNYKVRVQIFNIATQ